MILLIRDMRVRDIPKLRKHLERVWEERRKRKQRLNRRFDRAVQAVFGYEPNTVRVTTQDKQFGLLEKQLRLLAAFMGFKHEENLVGIEIKNLRQWAVLQAFAAYHTQRQRRRIRRFELYNLLSCVPRTNSTNRRIIRRRSKRVEEWRVRLFERVTSAIRQEVGTYANDVRWDDAIPPTFNLARFFRRVGIPGSEHLIEQQDEMLPHHTYRELRHLTMDMLYGDGLYRDQKRRDRPRWRTNAKEA